MIIASSPNLEFLNDSQIIPSQKEFTIRLYDRKFNNRYYYIILLVNHHQNQKKKNLLNLSILLIFIEIEEVHIKNQIYLNQNQYSIFINYYRKSFDDGFGINGFGISGKGI